MSLVFTTIEPQTESERANVLTLAALMQAGDIFHICSAAWEVDAVKCEHQTTVFAHRVKTMALEGQSFLFRNSQTLWVEREAKQ